jgi:hypothetical protein
LPGIERTLSLAHSAAARLRTARPLPLLAVLCAAQLLAALWVALSATHNHFLWYSGGDATEYWTASWSLAHGELPQAIVGYGVPVLYAWVPLLAGTTLISGIPVIVLVQAIVFVPLALVLFWAVADRLFGRLFAWWAAVLWVVGPLLMFIGFGPRYATQFKNLFLAPHWYGLTNMADLPSVVAVLATSWAALRLVERRTIEDGVLTGVLAGVLIGIKPANGFFLPALVVLLVAVRKIKPLVAAAGAFFPALATLALWKERGLGRLPVTAYQETREATAGHVVAAAGGGRYVHVDWGHLHDELLDLQEVFWSVRLLQFLVIAGVLAVLRRSAWRGTFVALWFLGFCAVKGSSERSSVTSVSYFRFVEPGLPAFVLIVAGLVFLVPRNGAPFDVPLPARALAGGRRTVGAAAALLAAVPLLLVVVASPAPEAHYARINELANDAPLSTALAVTTTSAGNDVKLTWRRYDTGTTRSYYAVYRSSTSDGCSVPAAGAKQCLLTGMAPVAFTRRTTYTDRTRGGRHWYRIALLSNFENAADGSDLMLLGPATSASTAR